MPQNDYNIINAPGAAVRADMNGAFAATQSQNSGPSEPSATIAYMIWVDTTTKTTKQRNATDSAWIILHKIDSKIIHKDDIGANKASAATVDLATATGKTLTVTGAVGPITSFGNVEAGFNFTIVFSGNPIIVHNVVTLILPGAIDIQAKPDDVMELVSLGGGNWRCTNFLTSAAAVIAPGIMMPHAGGSVPAGFLLADGASHDSIAVPSLAALFAAIGTTWGGTGADDFNVPNGIDRVAIGAGNLYALGTPVGSLNTDPSILSVAQLAAHFHNFNRTPIGGGGDDDDNQFLVTSQIFPATSSTGSNTGHFHTGNVPPANPFLWLIKI